MNTYALDCNRRRFYFKYCRHQVCRKWKCIFLWTFKINIFIRKVKPSSCLLQVSRMSFNFSCSPMYQYGESSWEAQGKVSERQTRVFSPLVRENDWIRTRSPNPQSQGETLNCVTWNVSQQNILESLVGREYHVKVTLGDCSIVLKGG